MGLRWNWLIVIFLISSLIAGLTDASELVKFKKQKIELSYKKIKKSITAEIAETPAQHSQGLMYRTQLNSNEGMLFVFKDEQIREFWMKNTLINLDIGYFNKDMVLVDIQHMKAVTSVLQKDIPTYPSKLPAQYALEVPENWFKKNNLTEGSRLQIPSRP